MTAFFEHHVSCDLFLNGDSGSSSRGLPFQFLFSSSPPLFLCFNCWGLNPRSHVKWGLPLSCNLAKALYLPSGCGYWDWPPWHDLTLAQALWILVSQDRQFSSSSLPFGFFSERRTLVLISYSPIVLLTQPCAFSWMTFIGDGEYYVLCLLLYLPCLLLPMG